MKRLLPFLLIPLLVACGKTVYHEDHTFTNNTWMRFEAESFEFSIRNIDEYYDIFATVTLDTNRFLNHDFPLVVNMTNEEGELRMFYANIPLFDPKTGQRAGEFDGSRQTATAKIRKYLSFNRKGAVKLEVKQGTSKYELPGVHSFGVSVKKAQMELPK